MSYSTVWLMVAVELKRRYENIEELENIYCLHGFWELATLSQSFEAATSHYLGSKYARLTKQQATSSQP